MGLGDRLTISQPLLGDQRRLLHLHPLVAVSTPLKEDRQAPGEGPEDRVVARVGGVSDGGQQHRSLLDEPRERLLVVRELLWYATGAGRGQRYRQPLRVQQPRAGIAAVRVMLQDAADGGPP